MPRFIQVMEKGIPASEINWPNKPFIISLAALLGLVFSAIVILSKNQIKQL
jgi:LPS O-antigen subunit length determinant protein (WzzB/FepE family)